MQHLGTFQGCIESQDWSLELNSIEKIPLEFPLENPLELPLEFNGKLKNIFYSNFSSIELQPVST